jgi:hypothetical protein
MTRRLKKLFVGTALGVAVAALPWSLALVIISGVSLLVCFPLCAAIVTLFIWNDLTFTYRLVSGR